MFTSVTAASGLVLNPRSPFLLQSFESTKDRACPEILRRRPHSDLASA